MCASIIATLSLNKLIKWALSALWETGIIMAYVHEYIGYEVIDGVRHYLSKDKTLVTDKKLAVQSASMMYFIERNLEPERVKVELD